MTTDAADRARLAEAFSWAVEQHAGHTRKGTDIPYTSHLLQVAGLVLEHGGSTDQAIAGLLHDVVEDTDATVDEVRRRFGPVVAGIVEACTDTLPGDTPQLKSDWRLRKERYLSRLEAAGPDVALVAACDKLHNLGTIIADVGRDGLGYLARFNPDSDQRWYYGTVVAVLGPKLERPLHDELVARYEELCRVVPERR